MNHAWNRGGHLANYLSGGGPAWTPAGLAGATLWANLQDATRRFQDSGLTTPAASASDPIGGITDAFGAGNNLLQSVSGKRPTLQQVTQGGATFWVARGDGAGTYLRSTFGIPLLSH